MESKLCALFFLVWLIGIHEKEGIDMSAMVKTTCSNFKGVLYANFNCIRGAFIKDKWELNLHDRAVSVFLVSGRQLHI